MQAWDLDVVSTRLRESAADPSLWPSTLDHLNKAVGGAGVILLGQGDRRLPIPPASSDLMRVTEDYVQNRWYEHDFRDSGQAKMIREGVFTDLDLITPDQMKRHPYYQDFLARHRRQFFAGIGFRAGSDLWCLSIQRHMDDGPFNSAEVEKLKHLWQPFSDAATLSRLIDKSTLPLFTQSLDLVSHAAFICDRKGAIIEVNATAERLIGAMIDPRTKSLRFPDAKSVSAFNGLIASALDGLLSASNQPRTTVITTLQGQQLMLRAIDLRGPNRFIFSRAAVLILLKPTVTTLAEVASYYYLSSSEEDVLRHLLSGRSTSEIAELRGVQANTVRAQLKAIFAKTDTHSQTQLTVKFGALTKN